MEVFDRTEQGYLEDRWMFACQVEFDQVEEFEVLKVIGKEPSVQTALARGSSDLGVYAIKTLGKRSSSAKQLERIRSEQACLRMITEGNTPFLPRLHRSFHDEARLYMVLVSFRCAITLLS